MKSIIEKITARLRIIPADAVGFVPVPIEDVRALQDCCEDFYEPERAPDRVWIRFVVLPAGGLAIRKWASYPFPGGVEFGAASLSDLGVMVEAGGR